MKGKGHSCDEAADGLQAIEKFKNCDSGDSYDTVLMDWEMPNMNGPDATAELRQIGCKCWIIGVTGNMMAEDVKTFMDHGANAVLAKPLDIDELYKLWRKFGRRSGNI